MEDWGKYIPLVLIAALTLLQIFVRLSARRMRGKPLPDLDGAIDPAIAAKERFIIYFSSAACHPCQQLAPLIARLAEESGAIVKLDALEHGELANRLHARGAPAFVFVEQGRVAQVHLGSLSEGRLRSWLG